MMQKSVFLALFLLWFGFSGRGLGEQIEKTLLRQQWAQTDDSDARRQLVLEAFKLLWGFKSKVDDSYVPTVKEITELFDIENDVISGESKSLFTTAEVVYQEASRTVPFFLADAKTRLTSTASVNILNDQRPDLQTRTIARLRRAIQGLKLEDAKHLSTETVKEWLDIPAMKLAGQGPYKGSA